MAEFDAAHRELCPDGGCIGIIGTDGRCRECGALADSALTHPRLRGMRGSTTQDSARSAATPPPAHRSDDDRPPSGAETDAFGEDRQLCPDGACIGVLDASGRCSECGQPPIDAVHAHPPPPDPSAARPPAPAGDDETTAAEDAFADRELCPDGACIGVLDTHGRCKLCGMDAAKS